MADSGFRIFGVVYEAKRYGHDFFLWLKKANFESLRKKATLVSESEFHKTYTHRWTPTNSNRATYAGLPEDAAVDAKLHEVQVTDTLTLYLVMSPEEDA